MGVSSCYSVHDGDDAEHPLQRGSDSREKMGAFAYISILEAVLKLAIVFVLQIPGSDKLKLYAVLMLAVQICIRMIYRRYCRKHFDEARYRPVLDKPLLREMCGFAGWNLIGQLANVGCTQGVNVLLNMFSGLLSMLPEVLPFRFRIRFGISV